MSALLSTLLRRLRLRRRPEPPWLIDDIGDDDLAG